MVGAGVALAVAVLLAFVFYYVVGFPANVPVALGSAVVVAELIDAAGEPERPGVRTIGKVLVHGALAAFAGWLGVLLAGLVDLS